MWATALGFSLREIAVHAHHVKTRREVIFDEPTIEILNLFTMLIPATVNMINREKFKMNLTTTYAYWTTIRAKNL